MRGRALPFGGEAGFSVIELLCGFALTLVVVAGAHRLLTGSQRASARNAAQATTLGNAALALDLIGATAQSAGYDPLGIDVVPVPRTEASRVTFAADLNGNGVVQPSSTGSELVTFSFQAQPGGGVRLLRIIDLTGDGDGSDEGEQEEEIAVDLEAIDSDGDGTVNPFLAYDSTPRPTLVRVAFGVRILGSGPSKSSTLIPFQAAFRVHNGLGLPELKCPAPGS